MECLYKPWGGWDDERLAHFLLPEAANWVRKIPLSVHNNKDVWLQHNDEKNAL